MTPNAPPGYVRESDGVVRQVTWPSQSPNLNPAEMVWDELDHRVKEKQQVQQVLSTSGDYSRWLPYEADWENAKTVLKAKCDYFEESTI